LLRQDFAALFRLAFHYSLRDEVLLDANKNKTKLDRRAKKSAVSGAFFGVLLAY